MKKLLSLFVLAFFLSVKAFALGPLVGTFTACTGSGAYVSESDSTMGGGTWSSSNTAVATVAPSGFAGAIVTGVSAGTATITYTYGTSYVTAPFTVSNPISPITGGPLSGCPGYTAALADATPGGTWSSTNPSVITVGSATGIVTAISGGTADILYVVGTGCSTASITATVTGAPPPPDSISGPTAICLGTTVTWTDLPAGGTWSSSNPAIATIGSASGIINSVSTGVVTITYTISGSCGLTSYETRSLTVSSTTSAGTITAPSTINVGASATLTDGVAGGTWSSSNPSVATIGTASGIVLGMAAGTDVISYTVSGCGGTATATATINVVTFDGISGYVLFPGTPYYGNVRVWLIHYDPPTHLLTGVDSVTVSSSGASAYYMFTGAATDSFRIKAAALTADTFGTGYVPTYHTSNFYWHDAAVLWHTAGTADVNQDISMAYGTTTTGPGFIAGNVLTGANKGTSGGVPAVGVHVCVVNAATAQIIQQTHTGSTGSYSFSNLPVGQTYYVFPDSLNYLTTAYTGITLTSASPSRNSADFGMHTVSKTILPITTGVNHLNVSGSTVIVYPNPTNGQLNLKWTEASDEKGNVTVTDIAGRTIYQCQIQMSQGTGSSHIDLSGLVDGTYVLSISSANINYSTKVELTR